MSLHETINDGDYLQNNHLFEPFSAEQEKILLDELESTQYEKTISKLQSTITAQAETIKALKEDAKYWYESATTRDKNPPTSIVEAEKRFKRHAALMAKIDKMELPEKPKEAQRWIPVSERLPETGSRRVFVTGIDLLFDDIDMCVFWGDHWNSDRGVTYELSEITHWMPLPELPKEGE